MNTAKIIEKINRIEDEAIKISRINDIIEDMGKTLKDMRFSPTARHALQLGYVDLLDKAYDDIQFVWLHLYQLRKAINDDMLAERTIDADPEVTADDLPFDGKEEKE